MPSNSGLANKGMIVRNRILSLAIVTLCLTGTAAIAGTLDDVKAKGFVQCGVNTGLPGFSTSDDQGNWSGLDVDFCRAVAAAVFADRTAVKFTGLTASERFEALQSAEIDLLSRNTTWTMTHDTSLGLNFVGVLYYDGQGFMVPKDLAVTSALELGGTTVCANTGTTTELNLADYFRTNNMDYVGVAFEKNDETIAAYDSGQCDVITTDASGLYAERLIMANPDAHMILPEIISKEPLGPVVREGDDAWFNLTKWTLNAMINAEELGVTSANVDEMLGSENPAVRRLLGTEGAFGEMIGVSNDWAYNIIKNVGNYGEIFNNNVGPDTPLGIARGLNALWSDGGIMYAPPIR